MPRALVLAIAADEHDPHVNALGIKGVGEIGITGAVANAVWHATGIRMHRAARSRNCFHVVPALSRDP